MLLKRLPLSLRDLQTKAGLKQRVKASAGEMAAAWLEAAELQRWKPGENLAWSDEAVKRTALLKNIKVNCYAKVVRIFQLSKISAHNFPIKKCSWPIFFTFSWVN